MPFQRDHPRKQEATQYAIERVLEAMLPPPSSFDTGLPGGTNGRIYTKFREKLDSGELDGREIEIELLLPGDEPNPDNSIDPLLSSSLPLPKEYSDAASLAGYLFGVAEAMRRHQPPRPRKQLRIKDAIDLLSRDYLRRTFGFEFETEAEFHLAIPRLELVTLQSSVLQLLRSDPTLLDKITPRQFEELIYEIFSNLGFEAQLTARTRDGGCDLIAFQKDALGIMTKYVVEGKHYHPQKNRVGVSVVRQLSAVRQKHGAHHGVIVTSSFFTADAIEENSQFYGLQLSDRSKLLEWLNMP